MDSYHIRGGRRLSGQLTVKGAKNAALPILAASLLPGSESVFENCPAISDVENMQEILRQLGCKVKREGGTVTVDSKGLASHTIPHKLMKEMRSSVFLMGPMLARCGEVFLGEPGGCAIGKRPIDLHLAALQELGAEIKEEAGLLHLKAGKLRGSRITLPFPSVGATENAMLAAVVAEGETVIENAAREPEIEDLQTYLLECGAKIQGAGTDKIAVQGVELLNGAHHRVIPDRIEAGTYLAAAAATGGEVLLMGVKPSHMESVLTCFKKSGCFVKCWENRVLLSAPDRLFAVDAIVTEPYPGFPTDMQSQFLTLMALADGESRIREEIFENRFKQVEELTKMGAEIEILGRSAIIKGMCALQGKNVCARDLRGGAALVIAGLCAEGETVVRNIRYIERGYAGFVETLWEMGADIQKCTEDEADGKKTES